MGHPLSDIFVGREEELRKLATALDAAAGGDGRIYMLSGEPGIGKTRTAEAIAEVGRERGFFVVNARCYEGEGAPLYWPWIQIIRYVLREYESEQLAQSIESFASVIAEMDSQIRQQLSDPQPAPIIEDPISARFRLSDSITTFLANIARDKPLLIILDDLHWADLPSLSLLEFFVHHGFPAPILLLGTYRDVELNRRHPLLDLLGDLARERPFDRIIIHGLEKPEIESYLRKSIETEPPDELLAEIHRLTLGNPLFVQEVVRLLVAEGVFDIGRSDLNNTIHRIPDGIRDAIGRRLNRLSVECNEVLALAAVIGNEFNIEVILRVQASEVNVLELIESALATGIIDESDEPGWYRFNHALTQRTLIEELSTARRIRLHAAVAEALVAEYGSSAEEHAIEIVKHYLEAETIVDPQIVFRFLAAAGEQALHSYAHEDAASFFNRALEVAAGDAVGEQRARVHHGLSRAYTAMVDDRAENYLLLAFEWYEENDLIKKAVFAAGSIIPFYPGIDLLEMFERALRHVPDRSIERARILANLAHVRAFHTEQNQQADCEFAEAIDIAAREGDVALQMRIEAKRSFVDSLRFDVNNQIERSRKVLDLARNCRDLRAETLAARTAANACFRIGATDEGLEHCRRYLEGSELLRDRGFMIHALHVSATFASELAHWDEAKAYWIRQTKITEMNPINDVSGARRAVAEADTGNDEEARRLLHRAIDRDETGYIAPYIAGLLIKYNDRSLLRPARTSLKTASENISSNRISAAGHRQRIAVVAAMIAYYEKDPTAADDLLARSQSSIKLPGSSYWTDQPLGFIDVARGKLDSAIEHFDRSVAKRRAARFVVQEGWNRFLRAETLCSRAGPGDDERAVEELNDLIGHCRLCELVLLERRTKTLLAVTSNKREDGNAEPIQSRPDGLTNREVEVLALVAHGNTNKQIADELFISPKTVGNHVQKILEKIGEANRAGAAAYAVKHAIE